MSEGRKLTIYRQFFTQSDCYQADDTSKFRGVQVHSTGSDNPFLWRYVQPDDGRLGVNKNGNSHNRPGGDVCASAYIGKLKDGTVAVYQALPWDTRCWISGKGRCGNANKVGFIGFEICEDDLNSESYFHAAVMTARNAITDRRMRRMPSVRAMAMAAAVMMHAVTAAVPRTARKIRARMLLTDFVADAADGLDDASRLAQLLAEGFDVHIDGARFALVIEAPDLGEDPVAGHDDALIDEEEF